MHAGQQRQLSAWGRRRWLPRADARLQPHAAGRARAWAALWHAYTHCLSPAASCWPGCRVGGCDPSGSQAGDGPQEAGSHHWHGRCLCVWQRCGPLLQPAAGRRERRGQDQQVTLGVVVQPRPRVWVQPPACTWVLPLVRRLPTSRALLGASPYSAAECLLSKDAACFTHMQLSPGTTHPWLPRPMLHPCKAPQVPPPPHPTTPLPGRVLRRLALRSTPTPQARRQRVSHHLCCPDQPV